MKLDALKLLVFLYAPITRGEDEHEARGATCYIQGTPKLRLYLLPPGSDRVKDVLTPVSLMLFPKLLEALAETIESLKPQLKGVCEVSGRLAGTDAATDRFCVDSLVEQVNRGVTSFCGPSPVCKGPSGAKINLKVYPLGAPFAPPVTLSVSMSTSVYSTDSSAFSVAVAQANEGLRSHFQLACLQHEVLMPVPRLWGPHDCVDALMRQSLAWIRGQCDDHLGYPKHKPHASSSDGAGTCTLTIVTSYVRIPAYTRRSREEYLANALRELPKLLAFASTAPNQDPLDLPCVVLFSDDMSFLYNVTMHVLNLREQGTQLGTLVARQLTPLPPDEERLKGGTPLLPHTHLARNAALVRAVVPWELNLKNNEALSRGVGRELSAAVWMQKLELCAMASDLLPSTEEVHWQDLSSRSDAFISIVRPDPGDLLTTTYPPRRSKASLDFQGRAPCAAWSIGWLLIMRAADARAHAEMFHASLAWLASKGRGFLDEEVVLGWAANVGGCRGEKILGPLMAIRDMCDLESVNCRSSEDWNG